MIGKYKGFSLVEFVVIVAFVGILIAISVPRMRYSTLYKKQASATAKKMITDLRRTRALAISDAAENTSGYALNMTGSSPYSGYEIVNLSTSTTITNGTFTIDPDVSCTDGDNFQFGPLGNVLTGSDTQLTIAAEGKTYTITIIPATGMIQCEEN